MDSFNVRYFIISFKLLRFFILVGFLSIGFSCKKETQSEKINILTVSVDVRNDSIYLNGNFPFSGSIIADSLGFVISSEKNPDINSLALFSDKHDDKGNFKLTIADKFTKDSVYYVRTVIQSEGYVYYGNEMSFISKNLNLPLIDDFIPKLGKDDEYVKIYGSNFSNDVNDVTVLFGLKSAQIISCSTNRILVKIPAYTNSENCNITVKIKYNKTISSKPFFLFGPVITNFSPDEGQGQLIITINGNNFSEIKWRNTVLIGSNLAEIVEASEKKLVVKADLTSYLPNPYTISVKVNEKTATSLSNLNVVTPWRKLSDLPIPGIAGAVTFRINNKIYLCTGTTNWNNTGYYMNLLLEYDILANVWTKKANFPGGDRDKAVGFSIGEKGYVGLGAGHNLEVYSDFWEYDPSKDSWTKKSDFPGGARQGSMGFTSNGVGYILMGRCLTDFWSYIPDSDTWQRLPDFISNGISESHIAILNDKLYVIGGTEACTGNSKSNIWRYDLAAKEWKFINTYTFFPVHIFYGNNKCYMLNWKNELFEFLPETNTLVRLPVFPGKLRAVWADRGAGLVFDNKIYYGSGSIGGYGECTNEFWAFDLN